MFDYGQSKLDDAGTASTWKNDWALWKAKFKFFGIKDHVASAVSNKASYIMALEDILEKSTDLNSYRSPAEVDSTALFFGDATSPKPTPTVKEKRVSATTATIAKVASGSTFSKVTFK